MAPSVSCLLLEWPHGERDGWELGGASSAGSAAGAYLVDMEWRAAIYLVQCWGLMDWPCLAKAERTAVILNVQVSFQKPAGPALADSWWRPLRATLTATTQSDICTISSRKRRAGNPILSKRLRCVHHILLRSTAIPSCTKPLKYKEHSCSAAGRRPPGPGYMARPDNLGGGETRCGVGSYCRWMS